MGYSTTIINLDEARLAAVQGAIVARIGDLDASLQLAPVSLAVGTATAALVLIGDPESFDSSTPFLICVCGGGREDGLDMEAEWRYVGQPVTVSSLRHRVCTNVWVYLHPDALPAADSTWPSIKAQVERRERMLSRICDFLRADVFEAAAVDLTLASKETNPAGDNLTMGHVVAIHKGRYEKSYGGQWSFYGAQIQVEHILC